MIPLTPKYKIGQKVFRGLASKSVEILPCPDCAGTLKWRAISPAGGEFEIPCPRCDQWSSVLPPLKTLTWKPYVKTLTISSVRTDTADEHSPITYMCVETGIGTGSVYNEQDLAETKDQALVIAQGLCDAAILNYQSKPAVVEQLKISTYTFARGIAEQDKNKIRDLKWKLRDAQKVIFDESLSDSECREKLKEDLETVPC
jgi:hypothetical protein